MASKVAKKRNDLSLKEKYEVIKLVAKEPNIGSRKLAERFHCGKTQITTILKNKDQIKELFESNASGSLSQFRKRNRKSEFADVNEALYEWYQLAVSKNIYPDGSLLMEKGKEIAERLGTTDFKASNGWLHRWKVRNNIKQRVISGESGEVRACTVDSWIERIPLIIEGYEAKNILNIDETGCFWKALPDKGLAQKKTECKGGKKSKLRLTIAFIVNALGESESLPIVIWKSENPRCFKKVKKAQLPVQYYSQKKSWMNGDILSKVLEKLNRKLCVEKRKVLLFMDNAGCHPPDIVDKFSNITVSFLPANTTSKLQPLDLGIIKNFKTHYRKLLMRYIVTKIESASTAADIVKSVNVLNAIRWIAEAWKDVQPIVIKKCFRKAGILDKDFHVVRKEVISQDPFQDLDEEEEEEEEDLDTELQELIERSNILDSCTASNFIAADEDLPICVDLDSARWEDDFFAELELDSESSSSKRPRTDSDVDNESNDDDESDDCYMSDPPALKITSYRQALSCLEDVHAFLEQRRHTSEATDVIAFTNKITSLHCKSLSNSHQTSLLDFVCTIPPQTDSSPEQ